MIGLYLEFQIGDSTETKKPLSRHFEISQITQVVGANQNFLAQVVGGSQKSLSSEHQLKSQHHFRTSCETG